MNATAKTFGYGRVSSADQSIARQMDSLWQYVRSERDIFADKQSDKDFNRPMYQALKNTLRSGDTLYIHSLDRLGHNKKQMLEELRYFKENNISVHILDLPTTMMDLNQYGELQGVLLEMINNILIEVLATMAETERRTIHKRQREGIIAAQKRNIKFGRPVKDLPDSFWIEDYPLWKTGKLTAVYLMKKYHLSSSTFYKKVNKEHGRDRPLSLHLLISAAKLIGGLPSILVTALRTASPQFFIKILLFLLVTKQSNFVNYLDSKFLIFDFIQPKICQGPFSVSVF